MSDNLREFLMGEFLKRFWTAAVSLAALVGAYLGAAAIHLAWVFWVVVGGGALIAGLFVFLPRAVEYANRVRNYPALLSRIGSLEGDVENLRAQLTQERDNAGTRWNEGIREGRAQFIGAAFAAMAGNITIAGTALRNERVLIIARTDGKVPTNGARYCVESELLGDNMGVVEVRAYDESRKAIILECVEAKVSEFWARLADTAAIDPTPPPGIVLVPYTVKIEPVTPVAAPITNVPE